MTHNMNALKIAKSITIHRVNFTDISLKIDELDEDVQKLRRRKIFDTIFVKKYERCQKIIKMTKLMVKTLTKFWSKLCHFLRTKKYW